MAFSKRNTNIEIRILLDANGFVAAQGVRLQEALEDGEVIADRTIKAPMTLNQVKTAVAAL